MFNGLPILVRSYRCPCGGACLFIEVIPIEHRKYEVPEHHAVAMMWRRPLRQGPPRCRGLLPRAPPHLRLVDRFDLGALDRAVPRVVSISYPVHLRLVNDEWKTWETGALDLDPVTNLIPTTRRIRR